MQGVDGAQKLSVQKLLDASSTDATKQFAAEVELGKKSIISLENGRDPLYIQQQQALLASLQQAFDKISPTALWLMEGSDYASEQAKVLLQEIDQFQKSDQELKEDMYNIQKFRQSILRLTSHMGEAKQAFQERKGGEYSYLWDRISTKLEQSRESWEKYSELLSQGKRERALQWKEVAEQSETSTMGIKEALQAYVSCNKQKGETLEKEHWRAYYLSDALACSLKSEEAHEKANQVAPKEKVFWEHLAEHYKNAASDQNKAFEAHHLGKEREAISWGWAGRLAYFNANYQLKALEAHEASNLVLAAGYEAVVETSQKAVDARKLAAERHAEGKLDEGNSWDLQGKSFQSKADYQAKLIEAQEVGKTVLALGYREAAESSQRAIDQLNLAAERHAEGEKRDGESCRWQGSSLQSQADYRVKAIEAQEVGKTALATGYREAAETSQRAADQSKLSAERIAEGKESEGMSWQKQGISLQSKANYQVKAIKAQEAKKTALAAGYLQAAETMQRAADQYKLSAEKSAEDKESESTSWFKQGKSLQSKADYQAKGLEAQEAGKREFAVGYLKIAETSQKAADTQKLSAERKAAEKRNEGFSWQGQGVSLQSKADYQAKALEAQEAGKGELAAGYLKAAETSQRGANAQKLSAERHAVEKLDEGNSWQNQGISLQSKADYQAKASEAQEAGKAALAAGYLEVAETSQVAADAWKLAAERYAAGKEKEGNGLQNQGASLQSKANYQAKAIEAQEAGKAALAAGYQEAAETSQRAADQYRELVRASASANTSDGNHLFHQAKATQAEADAIARQQSLVR
ncbi:MAG: hypothetical protein A3F67_04170 [Verrucomicrobia bacterium RIFCSPHIGHO2_12_FULL_41_10]|nr:MAG: hypothetical protein A3F67_04170 [Verrucomicrobia bacterium RIFCSPHIGHO2_12_FULL_41_10]